MIGHTPETGQRNYALDKDAEFDLAASRLREQRVPLPTGDDAQLNPDEEDYLVRNQGHVRLELEVQDALRRGRSSR